MQRLVRQGSGGWEYFCQECRTWHARVWLCCQGRTCCCTCLRRHHCADTQDEIARIVTVNKYLIEESRRRRNGRKPPVSQG